MNFGAYLAWHHPGNVRDLAVTCSGRLEQGDGIAVSVVSVWSILLGLVSQAGLLDVIRSGGME